MISKVTSKNIPDIWSDEQEPIRCYITAQLKEIKSIHPEMNFAVLDAHQFFDELWGYRIRPGVKVEYDNGYVKFLWENENGRLSIRFYGYGRWYYETYTKEGTLTFDGVGNMWDKRGHSLYDKDDSPYYFIMTQNVKKIYSLKDEFMNKYEPIFRKSGSGYRISGLVSIAWSVDFYDGPISGYCYLNNNFCFFDQIEETNISHDRMYAIYKLNFVDKLFAYFQHKIFTFLVSHRISGIWYKTREWWHGTENWYKILNEKRAEWCKRHEIVGYFSTEDW